MNILVVEDDREMADVLVRGLREEAHDVEIARDGNSALRLSGDSSFDLILLDVMLPGLNGLEVAKRLRMRSEQVPVLMLTARDALQDVVIGLDAGADDYLTKPFNPQELKARIRVGLRLLELEDNLVQAREAMRFKATHDPLTGVWNRGAILESLEKEVWRSRREGLSLGLLIADLDHFKSVNDTYGHPVGDTVLREVTRRMVTDVRPYDAVGRYGGEEFLVLLPGCNDSETRAKAERLREAISGELIGTAGGNLKVTMSVGGVATAEWPQDTSNQILQRADAALYRAKKEGRDRTVMSRAGEREEAPEPALQASSERPRNG